MITPEQLELRKGKLGASDLPAVVLGSDGFKTAADVYLFKTGQVEDQPTTDAMARGNFLEGSVMRWAASVLGREIIPTILPTQMHPSGLLCANLDGLLKYEGGKILESFEAKTVGRPDEDWGLEMTDQIPERVQVQVAGQFICVPTLEVVFIPVLMPFLKLNIYRVERNTKLCEIVEQEGLRFMTDHVLKRVPPASTPSMDVLKRIKRVPAKIVDVELSLYVADEIEQEKKKEAVKKADATRAALLAALGDAEGGRLSTGKVFTFLEYQRKGYTVASSSYRQFKPAKAL